MQEENEKKAPKAYEFGDITRGILQSYVATIESTKSKRSWREASGRQDGSDEYQFGDWSTYVASSVSSWFFPKQTKQPEEETPAEDRRSAALDYAEEVKQRRQQEKCVAKVRRNQEKFAVILGLVVSGERVTEEQLNSLWDVSRDLTAAQAAEVLVQQLEILKARPGSAVVSVDASGLSADEMDAVKENFCLAVDAVLSGNHITQDQLTGISTIARKVTTDVLVGLLTQKLMEHWMKKETAKKVGLDWVQSTYLFHRNCN